jgi:hypothetical protein
MATIEIARADQVGQYHSNELGYLSSSPKLYQLELQCET